MAAGDTVLVANPSPDVYGSDLQMLESIGGLVAAGRRVVVTLPNDGPLVPRILERGAEVAYLEYPVLRRANQSPAGFARMLWDALASLPRLVRQIRTLAPASLYVNTVTLPWWLLAGRLAGVPTACHLHEAETTDSRLVRRALISPLRLAHAVIVISRSTMDALLDADPGLAGRSHLVYNGVPQPDADPQLVARADGEPARLISIGRLSPRKAPHIAIEALAALLSEGYDAVLEVAGTAFPGYEWYVEELEARAAKPDLAGRVTFSGYCSPIWPALERSHIMLAPSLREPFGNAVVEAQYSLRPVVATAALGHTESITDGETGLLVPAEDAAAMAVAVKRLLDAPELAARIAVTARSEAIRRFSVPRYQKEIADLFDELTARRSRRG